MARRARFGRLPRSAPSLTNTIVAIAREMQNARDKNIMDAWKNGGSFEGRPVTDDMVLDHWRSRLDKVDKKDPLYDTYSNAVMQYEYAIAESKIATSYAQGKVSDSGMAAFYRNWATKVPKDSEFYRTLQRDAAQFMRSAAAKGRASAARAKEEGYQQAQEADYNKYEKAGEYLTEVFKQMARANALIGADLDTDLSQFDPSDPSRMMALLNQINGTGFFAGGKGGSAGGGNVLFTDPSTGRPITADYIKGQLSKLDPNFDGRINLSYYRTLVSRQLQGQNIRLKRAQETDHKGDANNLQKWIDYTSEIGREAALWPVAASYQTARQVFLNTWQSATATPETKLAAWQRYSAALTNLAGDATVDDNTRARLLAEVNGDGSVQSLAEDFTGLNSKDQTTTSGGFKGDIAETQFDVQRFLAMQEAVASGGAVWTPGQTDQQGVFRPTPGGTEIGAATLAEVQASSPVQPAVVFVPQAGGAKTIPVVVAGVNITATASDALGQKVPMTNANPIGSAYDVSVGGFRTRVFSYVDADGKTYYTTDAPWDERGVVARDTAAGIVLDVSAYVPRQDETGAWVYANGQPAAMDGSGGFGLSEPTQQGNQHLVFNPAGAVYSSDPARAAAGPDPTTDFFSPTLAALTSSPEGMRVLSELKDDPIFQAQLQFEAQQAAFDVTTGQVDQALLNKFNSQVSLATNLPAAGDAVVSFIDKVTDLWDRTNTKSTFASSATKTFEVRGADGIKTTRTVEPTETKLPTDLLRGDSAFSLLADVFEVGTNLFKQAVAKDADGPTLQISGQIKVPAAPTTSVTPTPTPPPAPTPAPPPTIEPPKTNIAPPPTIEDQTTFKKAGGGYAF